MRDLVGEGARGGELLPDEVSGGNMRHGEETGEAAGVGALADAWATKEDPVDVPVLGVSMTKGGDRRWRRR